MARYKQSLAQDAVKLYVTLAEKHGMTPTELSLAWCYSRKHVASTIIGATSIPQLEENIKAYDMISKISPEILSGIQEIYKKYRDPSKV